MQLKNRTIRKYRNRTLESAAQKRVKSESKSNNKSRKRQQPQRLSSSPQKSQNRMERNRKRPKKNGSEFWWRPIWIPTSRGCQKQRRPKTFRRSKRECWTLYRRQTAGFSTISENTQTETVWRQKDSSIDSTNCPKDTWKHLFSKTIIEIIKNY